MILWKKHNFIIKLKTTYNYIENLLLITFIMNDFWNNISRYPRFFISSVTGSILIILSPFKNLLKIKKLRIFVILLFILFGIILSNIIINMSGL